LSYGDLNNRLFMKDGNPWYMSPDVTLPGNQANVGPNTVTVVGRKNPGAFEGENVKIDAFICNPGFQMKPGNVPYTQPIGSVTIAVPDLDAAGPATGVSKTLPTLNIPTPPATPTQMQKDDAKGPGHRCLIARIYRFGIAPPTAVFTPITEQHEVQCNICVVQCSQDGADDAAGAGAGDVGTAGGKPLGPNEDGLFEFRLDTTTRTMRPERVTLRGVWPAKHPAPQLEELTAIMRRVRRFRGFADERPGRFAFRFDIPKAELPRRRGQPAYIPRVNRIVDKSGAKRGNPTFDALVTLQPKRQARVGFVADLSTTPVGRAQVFRLEQIGPQGRSHGGVTLIFLRVR
jgi:hypothetical protein